MGAAMPLCAAAGCSVESLVVHLHTQLPSKLALQHGPNPEHVLLVESVDFALHKDKVTALVQEWLKRVHAGVEWMDSDA